MFKQLLCKHNWHNWRLLSKKFPEEGIKIQICTKCYKVRQPQHIIFKILEIIKRLK